MTLPLWLLIVSCVLCAIPLAVTIANLRVYRKAVDGPPSDPDARVFVCVPARDEAANLEPCVRTLLAQDHPSVRVLVYDDQSTDGTGEILARLAAEDARVIPVPTHTLPDGWNGKQHGCWRMARAAMEGLTRADGTDEPAMHADERLLFTDADVRFEPDAVRRAVAEAERLEAPLLSGFPRQLTGTPAEAALVPMMFYLLLGYLPMWRMRTTLDPSTSAGCGQFILVTRAAYEASGGHESVRDSMHEGVKLPRAVRRAGLKTDLFDASDICSVRMYRGLSETWRGFTKNAYEGLGSVGLLVFMTVLHVVGHALPWIVVLGSLGGAVDATGAAVALSILAIGLQLTQRVLIARRVGHAWSGAALHIVGIVGMTVIQWHSYVLHLLGRRTWRGRTAGAVTGSGTA
ncbi:MAG: glycosyltransferase family 2 protein [Planctomycetota bacterium]